jgi:hypothetical protein
MPYTLNKTNGSVLATVQDGSINQATDLTFVGKNYAGYGEFVNENLLRLLENFSNRTQPSKAITGQLWYDSSTKKLKVYDGTNFQNLAYSTSASKAPSYTTLGDFWFDDQAKILKVYTKTGWLNVGPSSSSGTGVTGGNNSFVVATGVKDKDGGTHTITKYISIDKVTSNEEIIAVHSWDNAFTLNDSEDLKVDSRFTKIHKGINLAYTNDAGVSATAVTSATSAILWGTASDSLKLQGRDADYFLPASVYQDGISAGLEINNDDGIIVGQGGNRIFKFHSDTGQEEGKISAINGVKISFNLRYPTSAGPLTNALNIVGNKLTPGNSLATDIGLPNNRFANIYANTVTVTTLTATNIIGTTGQFNTINGTLTGNVTGDVTGNLYGNIIGGVISGGGSGGVNTQFITAGSAAATGVIQGKWSIEAGSTIDLITKKITTGAAATAGTITGAWSLTGGSTLQATYSDLAERYHADSIYEYGTVLVVGGENEVTVTTERASIAVAGIVSEQAAYKMNADAGTDTTHPYIALKGRVPCKVKGAVKKGDLLVTSEVPGFACAWQPGDDPNAVIGKALEDFEGPLGYVEVKV